MVNLYNYFSRIIESEPLKSEIKAVYRITGLSRLEELLKDVRTTSFPCLVVDEGADGVLNILSGSSDRGFYTFYLLDSASDERADVSLIFDIMERMFPLGKTVLRQMKSDAADYDQPCYGLDASSINYSRVSALGMQCYGYAFNVVIVKEDGL